MKHAIPLMTGLLIGTLAGVSIGWYFGYQRYAKKQEALVQEYHWVRDTVLKMTDAEIAGLGSEIPQYFEDVKRQDEMSAMVALSAYHSLEKGDLDTTKSRLAWHIGHYYRLYHAKGGDPIAIEKIESAALDYPLIAAQLSEPAK